MVTDRAIASRAVSILKPSGGASSRKGKPCSSSMISSIEGATRAPAMRERASTIMSAGIMRMSSATSTRMAASVSDMRVMPLSTAAAPSRAYAPGDQPACRSASARSWPKRRPRHAPMQMPGTKLPDGSATPKVSDARTKYEPRKRPSEAASKSSVGRRESKWLIVSSCAAKDERRDWKG